MDTPGHVMEELAVVAEPTKKAPHEKEKTPNYG